MSLKLGNKTYAIKQAEESGLSGLKGHRLVGGLRASIYNAFDIKIRDVNNTDTNVSDFNLNTKLASRAGDNITWNAETNQFDVTVEYRIVGQPIVETVNFILQRPE